MAAVAVTITNDGYEYVDPTTSRRTIVRGYRGPSRSRRFHVLGGPGGYLTAVSANRRLDGSRWRSFKHLATINRPLTPQLRDAAYDWVLRTHELVDTDEATSWA